MHRFFVSPAAFQGEELVLEREQARQIAAVLRLRPGEIIAALDNTGNEFHVSLTDVTVSRVRGHLVGHSAFSREPSTEIVLYQCLLKGDKFEWVLQKGTELGIAAFVPIVSERTQASQIGRSKRARWERILVEAAEQSARSRVPALAPLTDLTNALRAESDFGACALIPWEEERDHDLRSTLAPRGPVHLYIGPEGGFTRAEIEQASSFGVQPITLGPRILRAETAGLVAASAILFARGELDANSHHTEQVRP